MSTELTTPIKIEIPGIGTIESADLYLKSEVDRVIAHNKYKRCLAMARWCAAERDIYNLTPKFAKMNFYKKWCKRWLELAEVFNKNSAEQIKETK